MKNISWMKKMGLSIVITFFINISLFGQSDFAVKESQDAIGNTYRYVTDDPMNTRIYTLENGMEVYISPSNDESRIQAMVAVKAGSAVEPLESTGLAHYLEHMLFKGTSRIGTVNWNAEKPLLDQISALYEQHRFTDNEEEKKLIYAKIDSLSTIAAGYVAPNEFSKLAAAMGATGVNAATTYDFTYYRENIPSNELERWAELESERMNNVVLRLFHTELETVYEEYNRAQDSDGRQLFYALLDNLFKKHPYKRPVIGFPEHLKNPSMVNIHRFFNTYYVPNNMVVILSGEVVPEQAIPVLEKYFGKYGEKELPEVTFPKEDPITEPRVSELFSKEEEKVILAYRLNGKNTDDYKYSMIMDGLLSNSGKVGLLDINLNQAAKVHATSSSLLFLKDYGIHYFSGIPKKEQSLEEVQTLVREEIEKIKKGEFEEWLLEAIVNNMKLTHIQGLESSITKASYILYSVMYGVPYEKHVAFLSELDKVTKEDVVNFARERYADNYTLIYKRKGEKQLRQVEKPDITPLTLNNENESDFTKQFVQQEPEGLTPQFVDYKSTFPGTKLKNGMDFYFLKDTTGLFSFRYIIPAGKDHDGLLPFAMRYFRELGTSKFTPDSLKKELFRYGISFSISASDDKSYVNVRGLDEYFKEAVELTEHIFADVQNDPEIYRKQIEKLKVSRELQKDNVRAISAHAQQYMLYGGNNSFANDPSVSTLESQDPAVMLEKIAHLFNYKHTIYYAGNRSKKEAMRIVKKSHNLPKTFAEIPAKKEYNYLPLNSPGIYFMDYDMVQAQVRMVAKNNVPYSPELLAYKEMYDNYYGVGLGSIIFQEIRESRALAYSSGSYYQMEVTSDEDNVVVGYVGTQANKLSEAMHALEGLMDTLKFDPEKFEITRKAAIKSLESNRVPQKYWFGRYMGFLDKGIDYDVRETQYKILQEMTPEKFRDFFSKYIRNSNKQYFIRSKKENIDFESLKPFGELKEITREDIFGY